MGTLCCPQFTNNMQQSKQMLRANNKGHRLLLWQSVCDDSIIKAWTIRVINRMGGSEIWDKHGTTSEKDETTQGEG